MAERIRTGPKIDLTERGTPCEHCPWPDGPEITDRVRKAAQHGAWFACHSRGGGTCYGALATTKKYYNIQDEEGEDMTSKNAAKNARKRARREQPFVPLKQDLYAEVHRAVRGEVPPQYEGIGDDEMLRVIKASREQGMRSAVARANANMAPKRPVSSPYTPGRARGPVARPAQPPEPPVVLMTEAELEAEMATAREAGRSEMTMDELLRLLALPYVTSHGAALRNFIRGA